MAVSSLLINEGASAFPSGYRDQSEAALNNCRPGQRYVPPPPQLGIVSRRFLPRMVYLVGAHLGLRFPLVKSRFRCWASASLRTKAGSPLPGERRFKPLGIGVSGPSITGRFRWGKDFTENSLGLGRTHPAPLPARVSVDLAAYPRRAVCVQFVVQCGHRVALIGIVIRTRRPNFWTPGRAFGGGASSWLTAFPTRKMHYGQPLRSSYPGVRPVP